MVICGVGRRSLSHQHEREVATAAELTVDSGFGLGQHESPTVLGDGGAQDDGVARSHLVLEAHLVDTRV